MSTVARSQATTEKDLVTRIIIGIILSAMTLLMLIFAFPSANIWIFGFIGMVPMLIAEYRVLPKRWCFLSRIIGIDLWVFWLVTMLFGIKRETWFIQMVPLLTATLSYFTVAGVREFNERTHYRWFVLHGMMDWVGFEMLRRFIPLVRSHGLIAHTVHTQPWMIQPVAIFSVYGLSLLLLLINYALAQGTFVLIDRKWQFKGVHIIDKRLVNRWLAGAAATFVFTDSSRILTQKGARFLAIPTFEDYIPGFEKIFYIQMVFRSVENRIATIKADAAFSSAIIDPYGRILALKSAAPEGEAFALVADVPVMEPGTLYTRLGDWLGWISLAGFIFFMIYPDIVKKRQQK